MTGKSCAPAGTRKCHSRTIRTVKKAHIPTLRIAQMLPSNLLMSLVACKAKRNGKDKEKKADDFVPKCTEGLDDGRHNVCNECPALAQILRFGTVLC